MPETELRDACMGALELRAFVDTRMVFGAMIINPQCSGRAGQRVMQPRQSPEQLRDRWLVHVGQRNHSPFAA